MTSQRAKKLAQDVLRAPEREGECAGKSIIEMVRAELIRHCIRYLRHQEWMRTGRGKPADKIEQLRGEIIGLSRAVLIYELPYQRGDEAERKRVVSRALRKAKEIELRMTERRAEVKTVKPRDFRVTDSGSLQTDLEGFADKAVQDLNDMLNGEGVHKGHKRRQVGRCVYCECGVRAQGRLRK